MALKDLISDLSNFNGRSQYDKLDSQIQNGVDFIPNDDAIGFTPKTDLKSLYKKANSVYSATEFVPASDGVFSPKYVKDIFPTVFTSDFMTTPIASYVSNYPGEASLTWGNSPQKEMQNFAVGRSNTRVGLINDKRRGVFDHLTLTSFEHKSFPINQPNNMLDPTTVPDYSRYFSEMNGKSIHISPNGELKAGVRYGASVGGVFTNFGNGSALTDTKAAIHDHTTITLGDRLSVYNNYESPTEYSSQMVIAGDTILSKWPDAASTSLINPTPYGSGMNLLNAIYDPSSNLDESFTGTLTVLNTNLQNKFEFHNGASIANGQFSKVPSGLSDSNLFGTDNFRKVANTGPHEGKNTHPIIIRPLDSNWDNVLTETSGLGGTIGGILEGALDGLGILTRTSRDLADKVRIGTFLDSPAGSLFRAKQFAFQALNPTIESKIYNPSSTLGIAGNNDFFAGNFLRAMLTRAGSYLLPTHVERHLSIGFTGGGRYPGALEASSAAAKAVAVGLTLEKNPESRLAFQAAAYGVKVLPPTQKTGTAGAILTNAIELGNQAAKAATILLSPIMLAASNPNKYLFPISSAPKSVHNGNVSFIGGADLAIEDARSAREKQGGTFNKNTAKKTDGDLIKRHSTTEYALLTINKGYELTFPKPQDKKIVTNIGNPGLIKRTEESGVDKINALRYGEDYTTDGAKDFIKFKFRDVVNNKFIIFRAILDGISDSISPQYGEERYIGRPDKVYVYQGADRNVSFNFSIYPKTKKEFPVLMNKLDHLIGLCYPSYTEQDMMVTPFIELTLGDMFVNTAGLLFGLNVTVEDSGTWELDDGLQFPHYIKVACEFRHIGNKKLSSTGGHYDINKLKIPKLPVIAEGT